MVQYRARRQYMPENRQSLVSFRQLVQPRVLALFIPIAGCIVFSSFYGIQHSQSVANHTRIVNSQGHKASEPLSSTPSHTLTDTPNTASSANSNSLAAGSGSISGDSNPDNSSSTSTGTTPSGHPSLNFVTNGLQTICDQSAKTLAATTEQTSLTVEATRHTAQVTLLNAENLTSLLVTGQPSAAMTAENNLHATNVQQIQNTYNVSLNAAHC